jgi:paraquat-inducible protein B
MMRKPNITLIGAFILGGAVLAILGLLTLGAERYFSREPVFVMYFSGSVKGLNEGSAVVFKGVKIGAVDDISLQFDPATKQVQIQVLAKINPHSITATKGKDGTEDFFLQLIRQGLKAQLQHQNLLTGQLIIELDFHPEREGNYVHTKLPYPQIPTTPSSIEELTRTISNLPLQELVNKVSSALDGIERVTTSPELMQSVRSMNLALEDVRKLVQNINNHLPGLATDVRSTLEESRKLQASLDQAAQATRATMAQAEKAMKTVDRIGSEESPVMYQLSNALEKISDASDSVKALTDYLNRHPEALLRGRSEPGGR